MANKKLSEYRSSTREELTSQSKVVAIAAGTAENVNIKLADLVVNDLSTDSSFLPVSAAMVKDLEARKATIEYVDEKVPFKRAVFLIAGDFIAPYSIEVQATLENNIGVLNFTRTGVGSYSLNSPALFTYGKKVAFVHNVFGDSASKLQLSFEESGDPSYILFYNLDSNGLPVDGFDQHMIEVRVYS